MTIIEKNDKDVLNVSEDLAAVAKAERITFESLSKCLSKLKQDRTFVKETAERCHEGSLMEAFIMLADAVLLDVDAKFETCKNEAAELFKYFGEDQKTPLNEFFGTLCRFIAMFDKAKAEIYKKRDIEVSLRSGACQKKFRFPLTPTYLD